MIPKNIIQLYVGPENNEFNYLMHLHKGWKIAYPDWNVHVYRDRDIEDALLEYSEEALEAYKSIEILTYRADFARLILLYKYGGLYLDLDTRPAAPLIPNVIDSEQMQWGFLMTFEPDREGDLRNPDYRGVTTNNHIFAAAAGSELLKRMIDKIVKRIHAASNEDGNPFWIVPIVSTDAWGTMFLDELDMIAPENNYLKKHLEGGHGTVGWYWVSWDGVEVKTRKYRDFLRHIGSLTIKDFVDTNPIENAMDKVAMLYKNLPLNNGEIKISRSGLIGL